MANFELRFLCDTSDGSYIICKKIDDDIFIQTFNVTGHLSSVFLNKSTAIKFAKTLRTEINKIN